MQVDDDGVIHHVLEGGERRAPWVRDGSIDVARRRDHTAQHTAQHALSRALVDVARAETVSSRLGSGSCTIDVEGALDERLLARAEDLVNAIVMDDVVVRQLFPTPKSSAPALRRAPKVDRGIRVIDIDGFDMSPCGGRTARAPGRSAPCASWASSSTRAAGASPSTPVAGALDDARKKEAVLGELARDFTCGVLDVGQAVGKLQANLKARTDALSMARGELVDLLADRILAGHPPLPGEAVQRIVVLREHDDQGMLARSQGRLAARDDVVAFCAAPTKRAQADWSIVVQRGPQDGVRLRGLAQGRRGETGGRGGGRPERAEGRLPKSVSIEALARAPGTSSAT